MLNPYQAYRQIMRPSQAAKADSGTISIACAKLYKLIITTIKGAQNIRRPCCGVDVCFCCPIECQTVQPPKIRTIGANDPVSLVHPVRMSDIKAGNAKHIDAMALKKFKRRPTTTVFIGLLLDIDMEGGFLVSVKFSLRLY